MLSRGILRLSKRSSKSLDSADGKSDQCSTTESKRSSILKDEWSKYDDRLIECVNKSDIVKLKETLKKKGVSPVKVSRVGKTAIHIAVKKKCGEAVELMLTENPDLSCIDTQGRTVYHVAAINGDSDILKKLLDYSKWNLHVKDCKGMVALHYAVQSGVAECVKLLLKGDSPVDIKDNESKTPLLIAIEAEFEEIALMLIDHGVDVQVKDNQGRSAVVIANSLGLKAVVSALVSKGATLDQENDKSGNTSSDGWVSFKINANPKTPDSSNANAVSTPVNGHNGDSGEPEHSLDRKRGNTIPVIKVTPTHSASLKRRSMGCKAEEQSLTSAIIESLMFDVSADTVSEVDETEEEQLLLFEKGEQERKELEKQVAQRELRIEELKVEIEALRNKVSLEQQLRYSAEREVQQLKMEVENLTNASYSAPELISTKIEPTSNGLLNGFEGGEDEEDVEYRPKYQETETEELKDEGSVSEEEKESAAQEEEGEAREEDSAAQEEEEEEEVVVQEEGSVAQDEGSVAQEEGSVAQEEGSEEQEVESEEREEEAAEQKEKESLEQECVEVAVQEALDGDEVTESKEEEIVKQKEGEDSSSVQGDLSEEEGSHHGDEEEKSSHDGKSDDDHADDEDTDDGNGTSDLSGCHSTQDSMQVEIDVNDLESNTDITDKHSDICNSDYSRSQNISESENYDNDYLDGYQKERHDSSQSHINMLEERILCLEEELSSKEDLISQSQEQEKSFESTIHCYRNNIIACFQSNLDPQLTDILGRIIQMRAS